MYVCICNAIRETELARVGTATRDDAEACYAALGKRPACGACLEDADAFLARLRERELVAAG